MAKKFLSGIDLDGQLATAIGANVSTERLLGRSSAGTGAIEEISIGTGLSLISGTLSAAGGGAPGGSTTQIQYNNAGSFGGLSTLTTDGIDITLTGRFISSLNGAASAPPGAFTGTWFTGGTATTTKPQFLIEPLGATSNTWSTNGTGLGVNAASGFSGNLLDLQVNGTRRANVASNGDPRFGAFGTQAYSNGFIVTTNTAGNAYSGYWGNDKLQVASTMGIGWGTSNGYDGASLSLFRDAANTLAQRNGTNAQTFRCYGIFTDASNYVRAALSSTSTDVTLAAETAGTGADDIPLNLTAAGTGTVKVNSVAEVVASSTVANLPATPAVGMLTRVTDATTPTVGSTVVGGGSTAALVWYNGSNWVVVGGAGGSGVTDGDKGDITVSSSGASWTIDNDAVTFAKIQNITSARLLGRSTAGSGDAEEISIGSGLSLGSGTLNGTALTSTTPEPLGTAAVGTGLTAARADHVHAMPSASDVSALPLTFSANTITYGATVDLDMASRNGGYFTISLTGDLTFTTSNRAAGRTVTLRLICDATQRTLTVPAGWVFVGSKPANIAASKTAILSLSFFGTADSDCVAAYGVQS